MDNSLPQQDLCQYAFCQGGIHSHKDGTNKRPLLVFTALGAMTLQFRRGPARMLSGEQCRIFQADLRDAGLREIEAAGLNSSESRPMARLAAELYRDNYETRAPHVYFDRRYPAVPDFWQCKRLWRDHPVEFLTYITNVQRQILTRGTVSALKLVR